MTNLDMKLLGLRPYILIEFTDESSEDDPEVIGVSLKEGGTDEPMFTDMAEAVEALREIADMIEASL